MNPTRIGAGLAVLVLAASCTTTEPTTAPTTTTPPTTTAPTTTTTTTTTMPPRLTGITVADCPSVESANGRTSEYIPDDWNTWCEGYLWAVNYVQTDEGPAACEAFWNTTDADILEIFMNNSTYSEAVGIIDAMWVEC